MGLPSLTKLCLSTGTRSWVDRNNFNNKIQELLWTLRGDNSAAEKDRAALELAELSRNPLSHGGDEIEYAHTIWLTDGIPLLVDLVRKGTEMQKDSATIALFYASDDEVNQKAIVTAGGISAFLALLGQDATSTQFENAHHVLTTLAATNGDNCMAIVNALVALVRNGTETAKENALFLLTTLAATNGDNCMVIVHAGGIPPLVALLSGVATDLQKAHAMNLLMSLTITRNEDRDAAIRDTIDRHGGISALEALESGGATELLKQMATNTLKIIRRPKPLPGLDLRATAAFLGIAKPCQFMGTPPFYGFRGNGGWDPV
jgi:hypothetical protein